MMGTSASIELMVICGVSALRDSALPISRGFGAAQRGEN